MSEIGIRKELPRETTYCHFRYLVATDGTDDAIYGRRWYVWDIRIRVEDGVCDSKPVQFYERIDAEEPEPH